jgi:CBS domain-containing protein
MRENHVGALVVVDHRAGMDYPVGIVTDRDLVVEVLAQHVAPEMVSLNDVMTTEISTASQDDDILDTLNRMRELGVRRMPVVDKHGVLTGIVTVDDLLALLTDSFSSVIGLVTQEICTESAQRP